MTKLILKGSAPYLYRLGGLRKNSLDYIMLNLPFKCNYNCLKCCNRFRDYKAGALKLKKTEETIIKLKNCGAKVLVIAGEGEPTLNKDFRNLVKFTHKLGLIPYIFTNGSMIDKNLAAFLAKYDATLIINMDSFDPEKYDKYVSKRGAFDELMSNLKDIRKYYQKNIYPLGKNRVTSLAINTVLNNENFDQVQKIKKFCGDDIVYVVNEPINIGSAHKLWRPMYKKTKNMRLPKDVSYPLGTLAPGKECSYMRNGISIGSDGQILTCAYALDIQGFYGNIFDNDLLDARRKVMKSVDDFYAKYGASRCILRHPQYEKFKKIQKSNKLKLEL